MCVCVRERDGERGRGEREGKGERNRETEKWRMQGWGWSVSHTVYVSSRQFRSMHHIYGKGEKQKRREGAREIKSNREEERERER